MTLVGKRTYLTSALLTVLGVLQSAGILNLDPERLQAAAVALIGAAIAFARHAIGRQAPPDHTARAAIQRSPNTGLFSIVALALVATTTVGCATWDTVLGGVAEMLRDTRAAAPAVDGRDAVLTTDPAPTVSQAAGLAFLAVVEGDRRGELATEIAILCPAQLAHTCRSWQRGQPIKVSEAHWRAGELQVGDTTHQTYLELARCRTRANL